MTEQENYINYPAEYRETCETIEDDIRTYHEQIISIIHSGGLRSQLAILARIIDGKVKPGGTMAIVAEMNIENIIWMCGASLPRNYGEVLPTPFWKTELGHFLMRAIWLLHDGEWLSAQEAQALTGKSQSGFSQWYKRAGIQPYLSPDGRLAFLRGDIEAAIREK